MRPLRQLLALLLFLAACVSVDAQTREEITRYLVRLEVGVDNSVTVTEDITVTALGDRIKRGIYRDVPLGGVGPLGLGGRSFQMIGATRDGRAEPYRVERQADGVRVYLGDADVFLPPGQYSYRITYRMSDAVGHYDDHDELYWNATGDTWDFDIGTARVVVLPPDDAPVTQTAVYTGGFGETGRDAVIGTDPEGRPVFTTTRPLRAGEGITVAVGWPKGYVAPPSFRARLAAWLERRGVYAAAILTLLLVSAYYLFAWLRVGRDPPAGTIIPVYHPELPPAAMRFIERMGFDDTCFTAAVLSLATKGRLRIEEDDGDQVLVRVNDRSETRRPVSDGEQTLLSALFAGRDRVHVTQEDKGRLRLARSSIGTHLARTFDRVFFKKNLIWFAGGAVLTVLGALAVLALAPVGLEIVGAAAMPLLFVGVFGVSALRGLAGLGGSLRRGEYLRLVGVLLPFLVFAFVFVSFWQIGGDFIADLLRAGAMPIALVLLLLGTNVAFFYLLRAPTKIGREALDEIEGTRLYLTVAEEDRLRFQNPPEKTPEHFHELLPYAVALGVETEWTNQFRNEIADAQAESGQDPYLRPSWYRGRSGSGFGSAGDVGRLGSALSRSVAAATVTRSSSGGSGGGGFSGGGGGGGGGGGW